MEHYLMSWQFLALNKRFHPDSDFNILITGCSVQLHKDIINVQVSYTWEMETSIEGYQELLKIHYNYHRPLTVEISKILFDDH